MPDKNYKIGIDTSSNTSGVEKVDAKLKELKQSEVAAAEGASLLLQSAKEAHGEYENAAKALRNRAALSKDATKSLIRQARQSKDIVNALRNEAKQLLKVGQRARKTRKEYQDYVATQRSVERSAENLSKTQDKVSGSNKKLAKTNRHTGLAFLEVSRAVEDAQYGMRGVLNNIPQIITLFGGGAGLAGVVSIAAVTLTQLFERMGGGSTKISELADGLDELATSFGDLENATDIDDKFNAFIDNLDEQNKQVSANSSEIEKNIRLRQQLRSLDLSHLQADAKLKKLQIDELVRKGKISEPEAVAKKANIDRQVSAFKNQNQRSEISEELQILEREETSQANALQNLKKEFDKAKTGVSKKDIDARKRQARGEKIKGEKAFRELQKSLPGFFDKTVDFIDFRDDIKTEDEDLLKRFKDAQKALQDSPHKDAKDQEAYLLEIADIYAELGLRLNNRGSKRTDFELQIMKSGSATMDAISGLKESTRLNKEADELDAMRDKQNAIIADFEDKKRELETMIKELERKRSFKKEEFKTVSSTQDKEEASQNIVVADRVRAAKAKMAKEKQRKQKQDARKRLEEQRDKVDEQERLVKQGGQGVAVNAAAALEKGGNRLGKKDRKGLSTVESVFADGVVDKAEEVKLLAAMNALKESNKVKNTETLKALESMIAENRKQADVLKNLQLKNKELERTIKYDLK